MGTKRVGWARIQALINENNNQLQQRQFRYTTLSSDTTLTEEYSGMIIGVNGASALEVTLPVINSRAGLNFRFVLTDNTAHVDILQGDADDELVGSVMCLSNKDTGTSSDTKIRFASGTALAGDYIQVYSDGDDWLVGGQSAVNSGLIFA